MPLVNEEPQKPRKDFLPRKQRSITTCLLIIAILACWSKLAADIDAQWRHEVWNQNQGVLHDVVAAASR